MKRTLFAILIAMSLLFSCQTTTKNEVKMIKVDGITFVDMNKDGVLQPYEDTRLPVDERVEDLLSRLSREEKSSLLIGTGMKGFEGDFGAINPVVGESDFGIPGAAGTTTPLKKYGLPAIIATDGPAGVRISPTRPKDSTTYYATGFPVGTALAATWNVNLVEEVGETIGDEALKYGSDIQLAPALNIMRNPLCGRNFEYYSEDPLISGKIAAAMTRGIQSQYVGVSLKHFAANNNETNRMTIDVHVSQRALREIYLRGFEIVVKEANPRTIMSSYNKLNGTYTSASKELLTTVLREEWGFEGLVMTDWFGGFTEEPTKGTSGGYSLEQIRAGNDLLMPGVKKQKEAILMGLVKEEISAEDVDACVRRVLKTIFLSPRLHYYDYEEKPDLKAHAAISRQTATEGMVLLKNEKQTLPLASKNLSIATFGISSYNFIAGGTGSGDVNKAYAVSLTEGLVNAGYTLDKDLEALYRPYVEQEVARISELKKKNAFTPVSYVEMEVDNQLIEQKAQTSDVAIVTIGRSSGEFADRTLTQGDYLLTDSELSLIKSVSDAFHAAGKKVVVVLNVGGVIETDNWKDRADAILLAWLPGQEGGNAVADILKGEENPSGRLTMTFPMNYADIPFATEFPGIPQDNPEYVDYKEGVYVGYRYFTSFNVQPSYEFGFGLSYTSFEFKNLKVADLDLSKGKVTVTVDVRNTGERSGKEVVQLYLSAPNEQLDKPVRELKAFAKTKLLKPGETETITLVLSAKELASFHTDRQAWIADQGQYTVEVGASSLNIKQRANFNLAKEIVVEHVHNVLQNTASFTDMSRK